MSTEKIEYGLFNGGTEHDNTGWLFECFHTYDSLDRASEARDRLNTLRPQEAIANIGRVIIKQRIVTFTDWADVDA